MDPVPDPDPLHNFFAFTNRLCCRLLEGGVCERQAGGLPAGGQVSVQGVPGLLHVPGRAAGAGQPLLEPQVTQPTSLYFKYLQSML
jgi:hypothetical protein